MNLEMNTTSQTITFRELLAIDPAKRPTVRAIGGLCHGEIVTALLPDFWFSTGPKGLSRSWCVTPAEKFLIVQP